MKTVDEYGQVCGQAQSDSDVLMDEDYDDEEESEEESYQDQIDESESQSESTPDPLQAAQQVQINLKSQKGQNRPNFTNDLNFCNQILAKVHKESTTKMYLSPEMVVSPLPVLSDFICSSCECIPQQVKQCKTCSKLFDKDCLDEWIASCHKQKRATVACPGCSVDPFVEEHTINRITKNTLASFKFKCAIDDCNQTFMYNEASAHF